MDTQSVIRRPGSERKARARPTWLAVAALGMALAIGGCARWKPVESADEAAEPAGQLFSAASAIEDGWQHVHFRGATRYRIAAFNGHLAIQAVGRGSSSGLIRPVEVDSSRCARIRWSWAVTRLQPSADIRVREREDVAASLMLLFGDPGHLFDPRPVPTLRYVWTSDRLAVGSVVDSPYLPGVVRSFVVESGGARRGSWITVERNMVNDFRAAFGYEPPQPLQAVAIFTDNDQTGEAVEAYYAWARILCTE